jgi:porin
MSAALAYYTIFSLAPLLVISIAIAALFFGEKAAQGEILAQIQGFIGPDDAKAVQTMIQSTQKPVHGTIAATFGLGVLLWGASSVFTEMHDAMNTIWDVDVTARFGIWSLVKTRFLSFGMVLAIGFLLLVSLLLSAAMSGLAEYVEGRLAVPVTLFHVLDLLVSGLVITTLFAMIFKILPDIKIAWNDVWPGAVLTAILFTAGKFAIGFYIGKSVSVSASAYGAAASLVIVTITPQRRVARCLRYRWFVAIALAVRLLAGTEGEARAQASFPSAYEFNHPFSTTAPVSSVSGELQALPWDPLTKRWDKLQKQLDNRGIQLGIRYDGDIFTNSSGGLREGAAYLGNLNLQLTLDAQRLFGWPGVTMFLYGLGIHGGHPSSFVGDAQGVTNIEALAKWTFEEAWIQQNLFGNRFSVLAGRYDLNSEFYRLQSAGLFLNSSFGIGPEFSQSGQEGPSIFPNTSAGARFAIKPIKEIVFRTAVLDGVPVDRLNGTKDIFARNDGLLVVAEGVYLYRPSASEFTPRTRQFRIGRNSVGPYAGKIALGAWYYSAAFDDLAKVRPDGSPVRHHGSRGFYALADKTVYQHANYPERRMTLFGQFGIGDPRVNRFAYYTGGGLTVSGLIAGRNQDEIGFAIAGAHNGTQFMEGQRNQGLRMQRSEGAFELTYLAQFGSHLAVQPDLQFVVNPGTDPRIKNAIVFILGFELSF